MNNEWHTANTMKQDCGVTGATGGQEAIERADVKSLRKCRIQVQRTSYKSFTPCLHASTVYFRNCLATVRVILPPSAAIHPDGDVNS
jgi:hypothetical protein